jgi:hypothetical protein
MNIYLDETGDLGWSFDKPFQEGGSSRYLTITALIIPKPLSSRSKRIVKKTYQKRKQPTNIEIKGKDLAGQDQIDFAKRTVRLLLRETSIKVGAITVKKENVQPHIRKDPNKLYNYMVNFILLDEINRYPVVDFIPDPRTIKVESGNSLVDYLQTKLWFEYGSATIIKHIPVESHQSLNLQFVDFISHIIWSRYEFNRSGAFNILKPYILLKHLFF